MNFEKLINDIEPIKKKKLWNIFLYEERIAQIETNLLRDFEYYSNIAKEIDETASAEHMILSLLYKKHIKNIHYVLNIINAVSSNRENVSPINNNY